MRSKRKTTIITETDRVLIFNTKSPPAKGWRQEREESAGMVRLVQAAALATLRSSAVQPGWEPEQFLLTGTGNGRCISG